jgi:cephalosporin hydroxylase
MIETESIDRMGADQALARQANELFVNLCLHRYSYHFDWLGRPIVQFPQDIVAMQELVWQIKPDMIVETGIAHGGSLVFSASMLALLDMADAIAGGATMDPRQSHRCVVGVDIDIRPHNRAAIEAHPMASRIRMIQGSSVDPATVAEVHRAVRDVSPRRVLVCLDSNHTHDHVMAELDAYAGLVTPGSYCVVFDTVVERMPKELFPDRPWGPGDNPMTAVHAWLSRHPEFAIDRKIQDKLQLTVAPDGYLKRADA